MSPVGDGDVAIVGMAGHFPGAADVTELWQRVLGGEDCLVDLDPEGLIEQGVARQEAMAASYVRRAGVLEGVDQFDPSFFGIGRQDAAVMDPQHRHFMECAWEALEAGGIVPERFAGSIGVFAGCGMDTYLLNNLIPNRELVQRLGWFLLRHTGNDKDFLATSVSYRLDLRGPSVNVQTACSTSLVAVHLAVQSLLAMECDAAIAGGATIEVPHGVGYVYQEGEILSPDGRCRAFDRDSAGTVLTSGAGAVVLRRAPDAWNDGDPILALIKGSAVNNDGARKVSYLAPSVDGHADVVKEALAVAGIRGRDIQLLEAHGTGTPVGDPIEVAALTEAFRDSTGDVGFCRLTSTKPNIGHLDTAAGVASLIKVVQSLRHRTLPPLAHFTAPNPLLDLDSTPFTLSASAAVWPDTAVRRAGVSSLGVGGTNAHVIVEEAPDPPSREPSPGPHLLVVSGRDRSALSAQAERLATHLESTTAVDLGDVAHTLLARRRLHPVRAVVAVSNPSDAATQLRAAAKRPVTVAASVPLVAFMFPGGGSQYAGMARRLDARFEAFHRALADGIGRVRTMTGLDLSEYLGADAGADALNAPTISLPLVFLTSLALARQWLDWGVKPSCLIGHSLGEYVAAHLAGVLSLDDAVRLVTARAQLMEDVGGPGAAMLVVPLGEADARRITGDRVSIAVVNATDECVLAGHRAAIDAIAADLDGRGTSGTLVPLAAAAHSVLLDPVLDRFRAVVRDVTLSPPELPYVSNLSGTWITEAAATDPEYWVRHLRQTVRFADCLATALAVGPTVTIEVGPGHSLSSYARRAEAPPIATLTTLRHPRQDVDDTEYTMTTYGQLWATGVDIDPARWMPPAARAVTLPTYAFQKERCWIDAPTPVAAAAAPTHTLGVASPAPLERLQKPSEMLWRPAWREVAPVARVGLADRRWWIIGADDERTAAVARELSGRGATVGHVRPQQLGDVGDGDALVIVAPDEVDPLDVDGAVTHVLMPAIDAVRALGGARSGRVVILTRGALAVDGPAEHPAYAVALGVALVSAREYDELDVLLVDVDGEATALTTTVDEIAGRAGERVIAIRDGRSRAPELEHVDAVDSPVDAAFEAGGTYVITGGLGAIGSTIAEHIARLQGRVVVLTSSPLPDVDARDEWLGTHGPLDPTSQRLRRLAAIEAHGAPVRVVVADLARAGAIGDVLDDVETTSGPLSGVVHVAGTIRDRLIGQTERDDVDAVIGVKARVALELAADLPERGVPSLVLVSSTSTVLAPAGQVAYVAANAVLDALAGRAGTTRIVTVDYGVWNDIGMAHQIAEAGRLGLAEGDPVVHPAFERLLRRTDGSVELIGHLDTSLHWFVDEHRTDAGMAVLPGTAHLALMIDAVALAGSPDNTSLANVAIHQPLDVGDAHPSCVRVRIHGAAGEAIVQLDRDGGPGVGWITCSSAELGDGASERPTGAPAQPDLADPFDPLDGQRTRLRLGAHWDATAIGTFSDDTAAALIEQRSTIPTSPWSWTLDPARVDLATGVAVQLLRRQLEEDGLLVPVGYDRVTVHAPATSPLAVTAVRRELAEHHLPKVDVVIHDGARNVAIEIEGLQLWRVSDGPAIAIDTPIVGADGGGGGVPGNLSALSGGLGINAAEGVEILERVLGHGSARLVASSVDINDLLAASATPNSSPPPSAEPADPAQPPASIGERVRAIWQELLGVSEIAPTDDFFDLGGHSLVAIRLMTRLQRDVGVRLQLTDIFDAPTLETLTALVASKAPASEATTVASTADAERAPHRALVQISSRGDGAPLFIVHGAGGNVLFLWGLARALSGERAVYGFQAAGVNGQDMLDPSIEEMAARYVGELRASYPGPYLLGGYSGGGLVTLEMARQLIDLGETVTQVLLFDSVPPGRAAPGRAARLRHLAGNARQLGPRAVAPYGVHKMRTRYRKLTGKWDAIVQSNAEQNRELGHFPGEGYVNLYFYFSAIAERYTPSRVDVDVTVFKAAEVWPVQPADYYWSPYVGGELTVRVVPGNHHSMFYPELVPELAAVVRRRLAEIEASVTGGA